MTPTQIQSAYTNSGLLPAPLLRDAETDTKKCYTKIGLPMPSLPPSLPLLRDADIDT